MILFIPLIQHVEEKRPIQHSTPEMPWQKIEELTMSTTPQELDVFEDHE